MIIIVVELTPMDMYCMASVFCDRAICLVSRMQVVIVAQRSYIFLVKREMKSLSLHTYKYIFSSTDQLANTG